MKKSLQTFLLSFWLTAAAGVAAPVISFDEGTGTTGSNNNQAVGWQFNVLSPLTVTGLGWFDQGQDGLSISYEVGIWNPAGTLLTSVVVPAGTVAPLDGQYRMVALALGLSLGVGDGYIIGGLNSSSSLDRLAGNVSHTVDPRIAYVDAVFSGTSGFVRPVSFSSATTGFYGPMFAAEADSEIPEPSTLALGAAGLVALWVARKRQQR
jgi:hypothetical protein